MKGRVERGRFLFRTRTLNQTSTLPFSSSTVTTRLRNLRHLSRNTEWYERKRDRPLIVTMSITDSGTQGLVCRLETTNTSYDNNENWWLWPLLTLSSYYIGYVRVVPVITGSFLVFKQELNTFLYITRYREVFWYHVFGYIPYEHHNFTEPPLPPQPYLNLFFFSDLSEEFLRLLLFFLSNSS